MAKAAEVADEGGAGEGGEGVGLDGLAQVVAQGFRLGGRQLAGAFGKYFVIESASPILPSSTSSITAADVNCLPTDPDWKSVAGLTGTWCSTFASP